MTSVSDAVAAGARAIVGITAGLSEAGAEGARLEAEALAIARAAGAVLVGPNCLGVVDTTTGLQLAHAELPTGDVAVLSQSGNLVLDLAGLLADRGLGVSRFVSLGNQADLGLVDFLHACVDHERHPSRGRLHRGRRRRPCLRRRGPCPARRRQAAGPAGSGPHRGGGARRGLPHRLAHHVLDGGRRRVRGGGRDPGGPPDPDGRPAGRPARVAAAVRPPGRGPHRRGRARGGGRGRTGCGRVADAGADRRAHHRARDGAVGAGDGDQPGGPRRRGGAGPRTAMPEASRSCWPPTRWTVCC